MHGQYCMVCEEEDGHSDFLNTQSIKEDNSNHGSVQQLSEDELVIHVREGADGCPS